MQTTSGTWQPPSAAMPSIRAVSPVSGWLKRSSQEGSAAASTAKIANAVAMEIDLRIDRVTVLEDLETGEIIESRWKKWLKHDPVNMVTEHRKALKSLKGIFIDCGWRDQFHIHFGTRQLSRALSRAGIEHRYEEFDDTHSGIDYRMDRSLPFLYRALK